MSSTPASAAEKKMSIPLASSHYHDHDQHDHHNHDQINNDKDEDKHQDKHSPTVTTIPLHAYSDDAILSPSTFSPSNFSRLSFDDHLLEDGFPMIPKRRRWWDAMVLRVRNRPDAAAVDAHLPNGNANGFARSRPLRRRTRCYSYCVFGGISGLTVLAFLLITNLSLGIATLMWDGDYDAVLQNWGGRGTGTEGLSWYPTDFTRDITPIPCHSHNDYWRKVPLFSALRHGFTGVEADVWLFDQELYVGHNTASLTRNRTFQSLYINPLVKILEDQNKKTDFYNGTSHGVFDTDPDKSLTLLVDVKTGGAETWPWVLAQLEPLRKQGWLTFMEDGKVNTRAITVVGTGNTPFDVLTKNQTYRDAFFDAPLKDMWEPHAPSQATERDDEPPLDALDVAESLHPSSAHPRPANVGQGMSGVSPNDEFSQLNSYYASVSFAEAVGRMWRGRLSPKQIAIIRGQIRGAHKRGLKARYWDLPSWPLGLRNHVWETLVKEGVDMLNVDDLRGASRLVW